MTIRRFVSRGALISLSLVSVFFLSGKSSFRKDLPVEAASKHSIIFQNEPSDRSPEVYQGSFFYASTSEMLAALKVPLFPEDKLYAFPEPALGLGSIIKIYRAQPVIIKDAGQEKLVRTWSSKSVDVLKEQKIEVGEKDVVQPSEQSLFSVQSEPITITITRVSQSQLTLSEAIDFSTTYSDDSEMEKGQEKTVQVGEVGMVKKTYSSIRENGVETSRKLIDRTVSKQPVEEKISRGAKVVGYGSGGASWYDGVPALTAAHRTLPMGTKVRVVNVSNGSSVVVTIADRGPFIAGRVIDLSKDAFAQIASVGSGVASVRMEKVY